MSDAVLDEVLKEIEYREPECARCGRPMVTKGHFNRASEAEKLELWADGYEAHYTGDHCTPCNYRRGTPVTEEELRQRDAKRFRLPNYKALLDEGVTDPNEQARRLGLSRASLLQLVRTWKRRGQL